MLPAEPSAPGTARPRLMRPLGLCAILVLGPPALVVLALFWIYGFDTHHATRESIWWAERGRSLIPPAATDITLQQDFLDHRAVYTVSQADLNAFLDERFAWDGEVLDSFSERVPLGPERAGEAIGTLGWIATPHAVTYTYCTSNGAASDFYHDPITGLTYQVSAYW